MGFNISGLVIIRNFKENFEELQNLLGWDLEKGEEIDFETASSNWKEEDYCDVYFSEKGTLLFLEIDKCTTPYKLEEVNTLAFALSETTMAFSLDYCENGKEIRSIMEVDGEKIHDEGEKLKTEDTSEDTSEVIWNQIEVVLGKRFWDIQPEEKAHRYYFKSVVNSQKSVEEEVNVFNFLQPIDFYRYNYTDDELKTLFDDMVAYAKTNNFNFFLHPSLHDSKNLVLIQNFISFRSYVSNRNELLMFFNNKIPMESFSKIGKFTNQNLDANTATLLMQLINNMKPFHNLKEESYIPRRNKEDVKANTNNANEGQFLLLIFAFIFILLLIGGLIYAIINVLSL